MVGTPQNHHHHLSSTSDSLSSGILQVSQSDLSTTPTGSPVKDTPSAPLHVPVPALKASPPSTSPFGPVPRSDHRPIMRLPTCKYALCPRERHGETPTCFQDRYQVSVRAPPIPSIAPGPSLTPPFMILAPGRPDTVTDARARRVNV